MQSELEAAIAFDPKADARRGDGVHEIAPDVAYARLAIVNVAFIGRHGAGDRGWVLVDAGLAGFSHRIVKAAGRRFGAGARPAAIILTHGHFDHVGGLPDLAQQWDVPVYAHALERPYLTGAASYPPADPRASRGLMARSAALYPRGPIDLGERLKNLPADGSLPGLPGWRWLHTPGHCAGHVSLYREADRLVVAGDAFVTTRQESAWSVMRQDIELNGPPKYFTTDWDASRESVRSLTALDPLIALTGHGRPLRGPALQTGLRDLAARFQDRAVPRQGRYVGHPAVAEDGSAYAPPRR